MAKITRKNATTTIKLSDLLRKRKMTLSKFINEFGLLSYESLCARCERIGVAPPSVDLYNKAKGDEIVSSPTDGIIVLDFPKIIKEKTGEELTLETSDVVHQSTEEDGGNIISLSDDTKRTKKSLKKGWQHQMIQSSEPDLA